MSSRPIRLVCFDLGGVVVHICRTWQEAWLLASEKLKVQGIESSNRRDGVAVNGDPTVHPAFRQLNHLHQTGRIDLGEFAVRLSEAMGGSGGGWSPQEIEAVFDSWICGEYEGVTEVIDAIHAAGLETATLSNTSAEHWRQLRKFPAIARIRHRHASHLLGLAKPDPAVFRALEERVGCRGGEILFFDDLAENVAAALDVGWRAEQIDYARSSAHQIVAALQRHGAIENPANMHGVLRASRDL